MRIAVSTTVVIRRVKRDGTWGHWGPVGCASSVAHATMLQRSAPSSRALALTAADVRVISFREAVARDASGHCNIRAGASARGFRATSGQDRPGWCSCYPRHYETVFRGRMKQDVPPIWDQVEARMADRIERACGVRNLYEYVARHLAGRAQASVLGLGSGPCGSRLDGIAPLLRAQGCRMDLTCVDVNEAVLRQAEQEAQKRGIRFHAVVQDVNELSLEPDSYDVIVAYASLHHFLNLERVGEQVNRALRPDGLFATVDIPTHNGYLMWDETLRVVNAIWGVLPRQYKIAHSGVAEPTYVEVRENVDYSAGSFECINSEAILPALERHLLREAFVPAFALARRFFDTEFGPDYDWGQPLDRAIFEFVMALDTHYLDAGALRPETFFGAYRKRVGPPPSRAPREGPGAPARATTAAAAERPAAGLQVELARLRGELEAIYASRRLEGRAAASGRQARGATTPGRVAGSARAGAPAGPRPSAAGGAASAGPTSPRTSGGSPRTAADTRIPPCARSWPVPSGERRRPRRRRTWNPPALHAQGVVVVLEHAGAEALVQRARRHRRPRFRIRHAEHRQRSRSRTPARRAPGRDPGEVLEAIEKAVGHVDPGLVPAEIGDGTDQATSGRSR